MDNELLYRFLARLVATVHQYGVAMIVAGFAAHYLGVLAIKFRGYRFTAVMLVLCATVLFAVTAVGFGFLAFFYGMPFFYVVPALLIFRVFRSLTLLFSVLSGKTVNGTLEEESDVEHRSS